MIRFVFVSCVGASFAFLVLVALAALLSEWHNLTRREQRITKIALALCGACGLIAGLTSLFFR